MEIQNGLKEMKFHVELNMKKFFNMNCSSFIEFYSRFVQHELFTLVSKNMFRRFKLNRSAFEEDFESERRRK